METQHKHFFSLSNIYKLAPVNKTTKTMTNIMILHIMYKKNTLQE